ncbi:hypothetical protein LPJGGPFB_04809 [Ensifer adhaerens]|nr:hypothetical protein [Ensifer adhaerens]
MYMTDPRVSNRAVAIEIILRNWLTAHRYIKKVSERTPFRLESRSAPRCTLQLGYRFADFPLRLFFKADETVFGVRACED